LILLWPFSALLPDICNNIWQRCLSQPQWHSKRALSKTENRQLLC
jgi:hypothetical protein